MITYSPFFKPVFWIIMGLIYAVIFAGAPIWAEDLGLAMTWWKWVLAAIWYFLLSYTFAGAFTFLGEKEPAAWYKFLGFNLVIALILGIIIWFIV